jgi:hypothetical protein
MMTEPGASSAMPVVAYITGLGHSGSTLLDLMIAAHSRAFSVGEIKSLRRFATLSKGQPKHEYHANRLGNRCACGAETIWQCDFWSAVEGRLSATAGLSLADLDVGSSDRTVFQSHNRVLFSVVAEISGADVIIDSSKSPDRLVGLKGSPGIDLRPIHAVRHARGQIASAFRSYPPLKLLSAVASYNAVTLKIRKALRDTRHAVIRYEDLVRDPCATLAPVMQVLGLTLEAGQLDWARSVHHNLGGNGKVLLSRDSTLRLDESWKHSLGPLRRLEIDVLTAPAWVLNQAQRALVEPATGK